MEAQGVIAKVEKATPWYAGMVAVPKKNGSVRICVDLKPLNKYVLSEFHPLAKVDDILAQIQGARLFTKLDANSGFWQIPLADQSQLLTTFITPFGRHCYKKLPLGISSALEHFQRRMNEIFKGVEGVLCYDILVFRMDKEQHNLRLAMVFERLCSAGVTLNPDKCKFLKSRLTFLGHVIDENGIRPDPEKIATTTKMQPPTSITELTRFLGMAYQLGEFSPHLATLTKPVRELLSKRNSWFCEFHSHEACEEVKAWVQFVTEIWRRVKVHCLCMTETEG